MKKSNTPKTTSTDNSNAKKRTAKKNDSSTTTNANAPGFSWRLDVLKDLAEAQKAAAEAQRSLFELHKELESFKNGHKRSCNICEDADKCPFYSKNRILEQGEACLHIKTKKGTYKRPNDFIKSLSVSIEEKYNLS